jgi:uncharacterized protein YndB with AHSA1/START domain
MKAHDADIHTEEEPGMAATIAVCTHVNAGAERVFEALTGDLASFWVGDSHAEPVVGSVARLNPPSGRTLELRVDDLEPGRRVVWTPLTSLPRTPPWTGTTVTWLLSATEDGGTDVLVQHGDWPDDVPRAELGLLTYVWARVLRSLKEFMETGTPRPVIPAGETVPAATRPGR